MKTRENLYQKLPVFLLPWYQENKRNLPWRQDTDPYRILVSEIMLQQTRVDAVIDKYLQFMKNLPTIATLANCPQEQLLKLWEGLGYYSRAKNLQIAAKEIVQFGFPTTAEDLKKLKGIGEYTAGAIASIAFERPSPAVDGNVIRVLARYLHDTEEQAILRKKYFQELAPHYPPKACGNFTQSLMELGATICTPRNPACMLCPLVQYCQTKNDSLPCKKVKPLQPEESYTLFLFHDSDCIALAKRESGVLKGLFAFPMYAMHFIDNQHLEEYLKEENLEGFAIYPPKKHKHVFTHKIWQLTAYPIYLPDCKAQLCKQNTFKNLQYFDKTFIETNISLPSAFRWCLKYI